MKIFPTNGVQT